MDHTRHIGIFDASNLTITLIGAGGIGAITAVVLAKMGVPLISIWDDDIVDESNLSTQLYLMDDLNGVKVKRLSKLIQGFSDETKVITNRQRIGPGTTGLHLRASIVISSVDSIRSRQEIWTALTDGDWDWYLDARMGSEMFHLFSVNRLDQGWYERSLMALSEDSVPDEPCTSKATIYTAALAAGHIGMTVKDIATGRVPPHLLVHNIRDRILVSI